MECLAHRAPAPVALANPKVEHRLPASSASLKFAASPALGSKLVAKTRQAARASQPQLRRTTPRCEAAPEGAALTAPEKKSSSDDTIQQFLQRDYKYGFVSNIENVQIPKGLTEETVRLISAKKREPEWMLEFRLSAFRQWQKMTEPEWSDNRYPKIDFQDVIYYSEPKQKETKASLDEVDPELLATFDKLGISISEQKRLANVAVDVVFDSVSIATTFREELAKAGVIFCSISEAVREYPDLVRKYLGKVVPVADNYYAALNSAVFSDGSFCYIPKDTISPMELSTYFRINAMETGQFERTLIVADDRSYVSYLEGCTAPSYDKNQLHAAVVELWTGEGAEIKYSTVQNWYAGDKDGVGGIYNFVTKRGLCEGKNSKISWTQVETGSAITWKYPSVVLKGDNSSGEFYSVALTNNKQQADTGTKMIHVGKNTRSRIVSKGISAGQSLNCYRGLVQVQPTAHGARNYSQCDSMLIGDNAGANTYPYIQVKDPTARVEHEASTSKIGEDQLFYFQQRGIDAEKAVGMLISGFCREVFNELPLEFASEVNQLMSLKLEGSGTAVRGRGRDGGGVREEGRSKGVRYRAGIIRGDDEEGGVDAKGEDAGVVSARKWVAVCCPHMPASFVHKLFRKRLVRALSPPDSSLPPSTTGPSHARFNKLSRVSASQLLLPGTILCIPSSVQLHTGFEASAATRAVASSVSSAAPSSSFSSLPRGIQPEDVEMMQKCVLYKDEHILVINKPPGLPSQVTPSLPGNACPPRCLPPLCMRDFRDVCLPSACVIFETSQEASTNRCLPSASLILAAADWSKEGGMARVYWAVVIGRPKQLSGVINSPLHKPGNDSNSPTKELPAVTLYRVIQSSPSGGYWD
ncbi:unnamed protein product [Closterium sp. Naga37s-1]|nr:unnamed protein product [Closterium sp. Naga37s-1]